MNDKWIVFVIERSVREGMDYTARVVKPCFDFVDFRIDRGHAETLAKHYSEETGLRTVVIKGSVFGD